MHASCSIPPPDLTVGRPSTDCGYDPPPSLFVHGGGTPDAQLQDTLVDVGAVRVLLSHAFEYLLQVAMSSSWHEEGVWEETGRDDNSQQLITSCALVPASRISNVGGSGGGWGARASVADKGKGFSSDLAADSETEMGKLGGHGEWAVHCSHQIDAAERSLMF